MTIVNEKIFNTLKEMNKDEHPLTMQGDLFLWDKHFENALADIDCAIEKIEVAGIDCELFYLRERQINYFTEMNIVEQDKNHYVGL